MATTATAESTREAINKWWKVRQALFADQGTEKSPEAWARAHVLLVLATLGYHLQALNVVLYSVLRDAGSAVGEVYVHAGLHMELQWTCQEVRRAIALGMLFCSECWPMHIWQGFGCGVLGYKLWAKIMRNKPVCEKVDQAIILLKKRPLQVRIFSRSPARIGYTEPLLEKSKRADQLMAYMQTFVSQYEERGFPQPNLTPDQQLYVWNWYIAHAPWKGEEMYVNCGHDYKTVCSYQSDPGRLLWAWTAGRQAELRPGEAILLVQEHVQALAEWLQGLNGMTFKILKDSQLDQRNIRLNCFTRRFNLWHRNKQQGLIMIGCEPEDGKSPVEDLDNEPPPAYSETC
jgi:hypothetical protein